MTEATTPAVENTTPVAEGATAAPAKKAVAKKAVAKKTEDKPAAAKKVPGEKKKGLRKPQIKVLQCLSKSNKAMTRTQISDKAEVDGAMLTEYIGSSDAEIRAKNDVKVCMSLLTLKFVKHGAPEEGMTGACYEITAAGRAALEKALKAE